VQALLVKVEAKVYAIPISSVIEIIVARESDIKKIEYGETLLHRGHVLPVVRLDRLFRLSVTSDQLSVEDTDHRLPITDDRLNIVIVEFGSKKFGIVVDKLISQQDIVIKQLTKELKGIRGFAGATILGDGSVALVLDVATLI
jgi:two-component system chemotaxis sensor kinase CheA